MSSNLVSVRMLIVGVLLENEGCMKTRALPKLLRMKSAEHTDKVPSYYAMSKQLTKNPDGWFVVGEKDGKRSVRLTENVRVLEQIRTCFEESAIVCAENNSDEAKHFIDEVLVKLRQKMDSLRLPSFESEGGFAFLLRR